MKVRINAHNFKLINNDINVENAVKEIEEGVNKIFSIKPEYKVY